MVELPANQGGKLRMEYLLLVTWFLGSQSATSYQVSFATRQACETALSELRSDARRLNASQDTMRTPTGAPTPSGDAKSSATPVLSAVCVNQR